MRTITCVLERMIRQYKYLEKSLDDEMKKVLMFMKGFTEEQVRIKDTHEKPPSCWLDQAVDIDQEQPQLTGDTPIELSIYESILVNLSIWGLFSIPAPSIEKSGMILHQLITVY